MTDPIKIRGAGPSGLAAAITLARAGRAVTIYEKAKACGSRFKGDLQGLENWSSPVNIIEEMAQAGIDVNFDCDPFCDLTALDADLNRTHFRSDVPMFYLVKRGVNSGTLDQGLKAQALDLGVDIQFETPVDEDAVDIVASGPLSRKIFAIDTGIIFETDAEDAAYGMLNNDSSYLGYSYLLITKGYGCMCTVLFDNFPDVHDQFALVREAFQEVTGPIEMRNPREVGGYGSFSPHSEFVREGRLYVGEAAGLQDVLWGFGIRLALQSGTLAAQCLLDGRDYALAARQKFGDYARTGVVNRAVWEYMGNLGYKGFLTLGKWSTDPREFLHGLFQYKPWRRVVFPLALRDLRRRHPKVGY